MGLESPASPPPSVAPCTCRHCGGQFTAEAGQGEYCSPGCAAVHTRIVREGFEKYYALKDRTAVPVGSAVFQPRDFTWLAEAVQAAEAKSARASELIVDVQGIVCIGCVWLIEKLFARRPGALRLDVNATHGRLFWRWRTGEFDAVAFAKELQAFGYLVGPAGEKRDASNARGLRLRLGLCAAFAMNTMLFVLPGYFGLERDSEFFALFETCAALFATAALLTGGSYFAKRAWAGLRAGAMNLDVPITLGLLVGEAGSLYGWATGHSHLVYFDFVALFSFLMLIGRWTQEIAVERNRQSLLSLTREPAEVTVERAGSLSADRSDQSDPSDQTAPTDLPRTGAPHAAPVRTAVSALTRGAIFRLRAGQVVPVSARLLSEGATFTTEWINGEPEPRDLRAGQTVPAGATSATAAEVRLGALEDWAQSSLARLMESGGERGFRHAALEKIIRVYLFVIVALAFAGGAGWWWLGGDPLKALHVTIAVLVASCPCGLGVAWPLVEELAVAAARQSGVFVRELSVFPRLRRIRQVLFDKTGTLTLETPRLENPEVLRALDAPARARLWQLVAENPHPVARAIQEALAWECPEIAVGGGRVSGGEIVRTDVSAPRESAAVRGTVEHGSNAPDQSNYANRESSARFTEVVGQGMRLLADDGEWTLGRAGFGEGKSGDAATDSAVGMGRPRPVPSSPVADAVFAHNGEVLARFRFAESARADAAAELTALQRAGKSVFILSGDRRTKVESLAAKLGVPAAHAFGEMSPEAKHAWVAAHDADDTLMLGDGANDSLAFDAAFARGTPVIHRGVLEGKSDFYYLGRGLGGVRRLFVIAEQRRRAVRRVFAFAVCYNAGTVTLALCGLVNPIVAAVIMPISSLLSLGLAVWGMRPAFRRE